jgi:heme/copper-type cytochrome/quinol oxidase subunit 2
MSKIITVAYLVSLIAKLGAVAVFFIEAKIHENFDLPLEGEVARSLPIMIFTIMMMAAGITIWFVLFVFIFELRHFSDLLKSKNHEDYLKKKKKHNLSKRIFIVVINLLSVTYHTIVAI